LTYPRAALVWLVMLAGAIANGILREAAITPRLGGLRAHQVSCFTAIALFAAIVWTAARLAPFASSGQAWKVGALWTVSTVMFEFGFGRFARGLDWTRLLEDYAVWRGRLWPLVLAALWVLPPLVHGLHGRWLRGRGSVRI